MPQLKANDNQKWKLERMSDQDVLFEVKNGWGVITLNRPKALNALNWNMCTLMHDQLVKWASDESVKAVLIKGAGDRAFCAGGDIRWLNDTSKEDAACAADFFRTEYNLNSLIHHYPKPYIALMHGVIMGGGVGVSISASTKIVGEEIMWAMPETGIGLIPDIGGSHFLSRLEGGLGLYLGLTGHRLNGADAVYAGIATHVVPEAKFEELESTLLEMGEGALSQQSIDACVDGFTVEVDAPLAEFRSEIDQYFTKVETIEALQDDLSKVENDFTAKALKVLGRMSPTSLKLSVEAISKGHGLSFDECLVMEFGIVRKLMNGPDFHEGVRAQIIDKDRNPVWQPVAVEAVGTDYIEDYFADLGDQRLTISAKNF